MGAAEDYIYFVDKFPKDLKEVMGNLKRGVIKHELVIDEESYTNKAFKQSVNRIGFIFLLGLTLICATLLMMYKSDYKMVRVFFYSTMIISGLTALRLYIKTKSN